MIKRLTAKEMEVIMQIRVLAKRKFNSLPESLKKEQTLQREREQYTNRTDEQKEKIRKYNRDYRKKRRTNPEYRKHENELMRKQYWNRKQKEKG